MPLIELSGLVPAQRMWTLAPAGTGGGVQLYYLTTWKSDLCLDPPGYGTDQPGAHLDVYPCNWTNPGADNQQWHILDETGSGQFEIQNEKSGLCLDVTGWAPGGTSATICR